MRTKRATEASTQFGGFTIESLLLPDGETIRVGVSQLAEQFSLPKNHATREVKALLGGDIQLPKIRSELNSNPVNTVTLEQAVQFIMLLAMKRQNPKAIAFVESGFIVYAISKIQKSHGIAITEQEEQRKLREIQAARTEGKVGRRTLTDAAMEWHLKEFGYKPGREFYRAMTDQTKELLGFPLVKKHRDMCLEQGDKKALELYDFCEKVVASYIQGQNISPQEALALFEKHHPNKCKPKPIKHHWGALDLSAIM